MTNVIPELFLVNGYREHSLGAMMKLADRFFQKRVTENGKNLYFIDVYFYEYNNPNNSNGWFEVNLFNPYSFQIGFSGNQFETLEAVESYIRQIYDTLGCVPNLHNNY